MAHFNSPFQKRLITRHLVDYNTIQSSSWKIVNLFSRESSSPGGCCALISTGNRVPTDPLEVHQLFFVRNG